MDIVIPLLHRDSLYGDAELRYCLRSVDMYFDADQLWIITSRKREWLKDVNYIFAKDDTNVVRYERVRRKILKACDCKDVSDPFLLMNDDMFFTEKVDNIPHYYDGTLEDRTSGNNTYSRILRKTASHTDGLNYELHVPMVIQKDVFIENTISGLMYRSLYGYHSEIENKPMKDVKLYSKKDHTRVKDIADNNFCFSTSDFSLKIMGDFMKERYPNKSRWEV